MAKTIGGIVNWVDAMLPNAVDTTTKFVFIEDMFKDIKEYNTEYVVSDTTPTVADQAVYSLPSGISWRDLIYVGVSPTTFNSSNLTGSTTPFTEYLYKPERTVEIDSRWWEYSSTSIRIGTIPDDALHMRFKYLPNLVCNAATDSTTVFPGNDQMVGYIQNKLASQIAKYGSFPRIDLANNYELEAQEYLTKVKIESAKMKWKRISTDIGYRDWW